MAESVSHSSSVFGSQMIEKILHAIHGRKSAEQTFKKIWSDERFLPTIDQIRLAFSLDDEEHVRREWNSFVRNPRGSHEILTREYVNGLAAYLVERTKLIDVDISNMGLVLEVGAGEGSLAYFINAALRNMSKFRVIPTDSKMGWIKEETTFPVEKLDVDAALLKYSPAIVISSWMPKDIDWTRKFRNAPSVKEYILIGNTDNTGEPNETWGDHEADGFERILLNNLTQYQLPRFLGTYTDGSSTVDTRGVEKFKSVTVSFRRKQ